MKVDGVPMRPIRAVPARGAVEVIDQRALPHRLLVVRLDSPQAVFTAIRDMWLRGAPLIGAAAAYGLALQMNRDASDGALEDCAQRLRGARPTAVNLAWAIERVLCLLRPLAPAARPQAAWAEADAIADLVDRLSTRFGATRVIRFLPENTHDPDHAARAVPASFNPMTSDVWPAPDAAEPPLRPIQMFDPPQPIRITMAEVPDGPPRKFAWRRREYHIARAEGPERIAPEWWRNPDAPTRDYYRVEDAEGRRFWLFRAGPYSKEKPQPAWFMHGVFA